ncbi:MAG TPA: DUF2207 domain-containing protein [Woeseiaceae bacterium]|nr:DUF2207 domain-containing protein [Woeseiaceae bacterium]
MSRIVIALLLVCSTALGDERILGYHSDILVRQDGWIEVTETISVRAEGKDIRRGIYRDYPTRYRDDFGNSLEVRYEPRSLLRDGQAESFHTEKRGNGVRTYFGSADRRLDPGEYTYTWRYDAGRMLGFFEEYDELYWNVTGLGWQFPIDRASATVSFDFDLPPEAVSAKAYTGTFGSRGEDYSASTESGRAQVNVETTKPLRAGEGLTIAVSWPKGYVVKPSVIQRAIWLVADNANLLVALGGLVAILGYYIPVWRRFGRDPKEGLVVTRYEPPEGFSPASLRYIDRMSYDNKVMTAAVVNLAVKGYLRIEKAGKTHVLHRLGAGPVAAPLAAGEQALLSQLFRDGSRIELEAGNYKLIGKAMENHRSSLKRDYANRYFRTNGAMNLPAVLIALASSVIAFAVGGPTPFVVGLVILMVVAIIVFAILMKRPTGLGRKVLDQAAGFREYLEVAEKEEMNLRNPPEKTPELFERYLPFALAMDVEQRWAERFAEIFANLRGAGGAPYHPAWYNGTWNVNNFSHATASMTSGLSSAISSSAKAPGSSSGSGSGGFSGGGGGGGGGGGW